MKHGEGKDEARDLYCFQQCTFDEIAQRIGRSEKTVRAWAAADGWKQAREDVVASQTSTRAKLHALIDKVTDRMIRDCETGEDLSPQSLHALTNLVTATKNLFSYESKAKSEEPAADAPAATPEDIAARVAAIMGA
jgi:homoserine dehydrogenase